MKTFEPGDLIRIERPPLIKINVSNNKNNSIGQVTEVDYKDKTAKVKTRTSKDKGDWESLGWLKKFP